MTIRIKKDSIEFVDDNNGTTFTLRETKSGFTFDGAITSYWPIESMNQGSVAGFVTGGTNTAGAGTSQIDRIPFAAGGANGTSVGNMVQAIAGRRNSGMSSKTHGYTAGGYIGPIGSSAKIERFPFTTSAGATDIGNLARGTAVNTISHVYASGQIGFNSSGYSGGSGLTQIERIHFVTQQPAFIVGGMATSRGDCGSISSHSHGYFIAGYTNSPAPSFLTGEVLRFPFSGQASNLTNRVDANMLGWVAGPWIPSLPAGGNMSRNGYQTATAGIIVGGQSPGGPAYTKSVYKFTWAADTNYNSVGDIDISNPVTGVIGGGSTSVPFQSTEYGYAAGALTNPGTVQTWIIKFPFAAELAHAYIGDTPASHSSGSGHHF